VPRGGQPSHTTLAVIVAEIERTMKKVDEGVELFDEIWEKVYSAEQQNQKEKFEMDLKKEIKKLQRHRDQIKTWISGSEVKDKEPLLDARRLIESKMEQFKICEKETKTKTYSKEGLAREDKLDPEDEAKLNTTNWVSDYIEKFNQEVEEKDFEIEKLSSGKGKKSQKHKIEALQQYVQQHKFHISKLEGIIRLVNNDVLGVDVVDPLKDDLDYYLESYEDEDYAAAYDEEYFYESLGLDELDVVNVDRVTNINKKADDTTSTTSSRGSKNKSSSKKAASSMVIPLTIGRARSSKDKAKEEEKPTPTKIGRASSTASAKSETPVSVPQAVKASTPTPSAAPSQPGTSMAAILKRESEQQEKERQAKVRLSVFRIVVFITFSLTIIYS
jgi:CCR4-NOT transcription complex subunit 3